MIELVEGFTLSIGEAYTVLFPLLVFVLILLVYSILIFKFYKVLSRKNIFQLKLSKNSIFHQFGGRIIFAIENILITPILILISLVIISLLLFLMNEDYALGGIVLIAAAIVEVVRITAYYDESLSHDLAKMLPLAMLAIFIMDINVFSIDKLGERLGSFVFDPMLLKFVIYAFALIWVTETVLTLLYALLGKAEIVKPQILEEQK